MTMDVFKNYLRPEVKGVLAKDTAMYFATLAGLFLPGLRGRSPGIAHALKDGAPVSGRQAGRVRRALVVAEVGVTVVLLGAAYGLSQYLALWASLLIVGGAVVVLGIGLAFAGKRQLEWEKLEPRKFKESLRADQRLLREQVTT